MGFVKDESEVQKCVDFVINNPSKYIFLAVGSPQQEIVAKAISKNGNARGLAFCIGASILFLSGSERRAPNVFFSARS